MTELITRDAKGTPRATLILAHGAGAPMDSDYMNILCDALASRGIATVRFEFPYMVRRRHEGGRRPPDRQPLLLQAWREVFESVRGNARGKLLIGGKSMGGRMASIVAQELQPDGFCCFGYPFHPPGKPDKVRTEHFYTTTVPGLILQGTRDAFGKPDQIDPSPWPDNLRLVWLEEGDHDYKARKKSGLTQIQVIEAAADAVAEWLQGL